MDSSKSRRVFSRDEVAEHDSIENGVWVTYKKGVYDVTAFVNEHPGGPQNLLLAAGNDVGGFFQYWAQHLKSKKVLPILESYRIGMLDGDGDGDGEEDDMLDGDDDPYVEEPQRHPNLVCPPNNPRGRPYCAEPRYLPDAYLTPNEQFFVRNHAPVPVIDPAHFQLSVSASASGKPVSLSLVQLQSMRQHTVTAAFQCTANRIDEMAAVGNSRFTNRDGSKNWIGNAEWAGPALGEVLAASGRY
jgi:sulfite oxidase